MVPASEGFFIGKMGKNRCFRPKKACFWALFHQMLKVIHRTHGGDAFSKKSFKKPLTYALQNDILTKLSL